MRNVMQVVAALLLAGLALGCQTTHAKLKTSDQALAPEETKLPLPPQVESITMVCRFGGGPVRIPFTCDSVRLSELAKTELDKCVAEMLRFTRDRIQITGFTCDLGEAAYNQDLGMRRAEVVKEYFVSRGIDPSRIMVKSFGEDKPAVPNTNPRNRALNRRVEVNTEPRE